jgi:Nucleotide-diphospho-sugar transferase
MEEGWQPHMKSTVCIAEDRQVCEPALKLLLLSLTRHSSAAPINLFYPCADQGFLTWLQRCPQVSLQTDRLKNGYGWNVKPQALMQLLDVGYDEVIWVDSDVIVNRDLLPLFASLSNDTFVATEDALGDDRDDSNALRARLWGFPVGRIFPFGLNSGVLRVTKVHCSLVQRWWELLQSSAYQNSQEKEWRQRPAHMLGDQDVLTALLTSREFSEIPVHILRRGKDILQFNGVYGYSVAERIRNLLTGRPTFVHSFAGKPWSERWSEPSANLKDYIKRIYLDLSPYTLSAMHFRKELDCDVEWMKPHYAFSKAMRAVGLGIPELVGLPIAALMDCTRVVKYMRKSNRSEGVRTVPPNI